MLMGPNDGSIDEVALPIDLSLLIRLLLECSQDPIPDARFLPPIEATGDGAPGAIALRQIPPGSTGLENPEDPVDDPPMVVVGTADLWLLRGKQGLQPLPLRFGKCVSFHTSMVWLGYNICKRNLAA
jgi:hypothetical protein